MGMRALNTVLLACAFALLLASGTQREKSVLSEGHEDAVRALEASYYAHRDRSRSVSSRRVTSTQVHQASRSLRSAPPQPH